VLYEKRAFRLVICAFEINVTCDQVLAILVLVIPELTVSELLHMSNDTYKAHLLLFNSLSYKVNLV
jgi:hypothetical protein